MHRRKKLVFWRIGQRLKQKDLCDALEITTAHYSNLERGLSDPSYNLLMKFRELYSVPDVLDLFEKEKEPWQQ